MLPFIRLYQVLFLDHLCMNPELIEKVELDMNHKRRDWSEQCHR